MRAVIALVALAACSKAEPVGEAPVGEKPVAGPSGSSTATSTTPSTATSTPAPGDATRAKLADAWKAGGIKAAEFSPVADSPVGKDCASTNASNLDIQVCVFASAADAKAAEAKGLAWVGPTTGISQAKGATLIVVADRGKSDPHGKTINQLIKLAP